MTAIGFETYVAERHPTPRLNARLPTAISQKTRFIKCGLARSKTPPVDSETTQVRSANVSHGSFSDTGGRKSLPSALFAVPHKADTTAAPLTTVP
jgi:hypothetical protein